MSERSTTQQAAVFLLYGCFGASSLVYEQTWMRLVGQVVGLEVAASALVLAVYMGGLGLGAALGARAFTRRQPTLRTFAGCELFVASWSAFVPLVLALIAGVDSWPLRLVLVSLLLAPATIGMGATFPALVNVVGSAGKLYAVNTFGAVLGLLAAAMWSIPSLGLRTTNLGAVGLGLLVATAALFLRPGTPCARERAGLDSFGLPSGTVVPLFVAAGACGFAGLGLEVVWIRVLSIELGESILAQATTLAVVLFATAIGALGSASWSRLWNVTALSTCLVGLSVLALFGPTMLQWTRGLSLDLPPTMRAMVVGGILLGPLHVALGAAASIGFKLHPWQRGLGAGAMYGANTLGAVLGATSAGLLTIPVFGSSTSVAIFVVPALLAAAGLVATQIDKRTGIVLGASGLLACATWVRVDEHRFFPRENRIFVQEDEVGLVEVVERPGGVRELLTDSRNTWGSTAPLMVHGMRRQGWLPLLLHPNPTRVVEIGLATGINFAPMLIDPRVREAEVVEISPAVVSASETFADLNGGLHDHPRATIHKGDGRAFLRGSKGDYDLVVIGLLAPHRPGAAFLFSREFYALCSDRLAPGGRVVHWLPLDQLDPDSLRAVISAFLATFEDVHAFEKAHYLMLVGGHEPLDLRVRPFAERTRPKVVADDLERFGLDDPLDLIASYLVDRPGLETFVAGQAPATDDRPEIEWASAPDDEVYARAVVNLTALLDLAVIPETMLADLDEQQVAVLKRKFGSRRAMLRAAVAQARGHDAEAAEGFARAVQLNPKNHLAAAQLRRYQGRMLKVQR